MPSPWYTWGGMRNDSFPVHDCALLAGGSPGPNGGMWLGDLKSKSVSYSSLGYCCESDSCVGPYRHGGLDSSLPPGIIVHAQGSGFTRQRLTVWSA
jgi:hypothetical protein